MNIHIRSTYKHFLLLSGGKVNQHFPALFVRYSHPKNIYVKLTRSYNEIHHIYHSYTKRVVYIQLLNVGLLHICYIWCCLAQGKTQLPYNLPQHKDHIIIQSSSNTYNIFGDLYTLPTMYI